MAWPVVLLFVVCVVLCLRLVKPLVYDVVITHMTAKWYEAVLEDVPANSHILDVGIGTGTALAANAALVNKRGILVSGLDYEASYVDKCATVISQHAELKGSCRVVRRSVYDLTSDNLSSMQDWRGATSPSKTPVTCAYFSGSLMIMPDPVAALRLVASLLPPGGVIYSTQTIQESSKHWTSVISEFLKPVVSFITTIDFGTVTHREKFDQAVSEAGLELQRTTRLPGLMGKLSEDSPVQCYMLVLVPKSGTESSASHTERTDAESAASRGGRKTRSRSRKVD